jgi:hypothetical protein
MYFYTDLPGSGHGLAGVNINTGQTERRIRFNDLDERFVTDEVLDLMYSAESNRVLAHHIDSSQ